MAPKKKKEEQKQSTMLHL